MFEFITDEDERGQVGIGTLIVFIAMVLVAAIAAGVLINTAGFLQTQAEDTGTDSTDQVANNINVIGAVADVNDPAAVNDSTDTGEDYEVLDSAYNDSNNPDAYEVRLTVQKSPGAADVDLSGLTVQYVGSDSFDNLVHASTQLNESDEPEGGAYQGAYLVQAVTAETEDDTVMTASSDRYEIVIPTGVYWDHDIDNVSQGGLLTADNSTDGGDLVATETYANEDDIDVDLSENDLDNTNLERLSESSNLELTITTESGSQRYVNLQVPDSLVGDEGGTVQL
ncbi:MAG: archaellin/type IV pilin N-terminal domain-containing protein [archaeon]